MARRFHILEWINRPEGYKDKYRIAENVDTCDGVRTRLTHSVFSNLDEAEAFVKELEAEFNASSK